MGNILKRMCGLMGTPDRYSGEGYEPSPFSRMLAISSTTDYKPVVFTKKYTGPKKILIVCTSQRYMIMANNKKFSTGHHPVEVGQPLMHLVAAGFDFDFATPTGQPACIEEWALPLKDKTFMDFYESLKPKIEKPLSLAKVVSSESSMAEYCCLFCPGGQGSMLMLPDDPSLDKMIQYIKRQDLYLMSICHGPAAFLAAKSDPHPYAGYKITCFPDVIDKQTPMVGYMPGEQTWYYGEKLVERGINIVDFNKSKVDGNFVEDRKLLTGDSPLAAQKLGVTMAERLLAEYA